MLITTMNDVPGYEIEEVFGEVFGLTVRSRNVGSQFGAWLKSLRGGELKGMTKMLAEGRQHANRAVGRGGASEGRRRSRRLPVRLVGTGQHLDRDLRLRHRCQGTQAQSRLTKRTNRRDRTPASDRARLLVAVSGHSVATFGAG